jgi:hypothetical protein
VNVENRQKGADPLVGREDFAGRSLATRKRAVALPVIFPGKIRPGKIFVLIVLGPGNFLLQPESGRKIFRFVPVTAGKNLQ